MGPPALAERVKELTDLELAILLSLVASQHCIIQTEQSGLKPLEQELQLIASNIFGLDHAVVRCNESTTIEDFSNGILVKRDTPGEFDTGIGKEFDFEEGFERKNRSKDSAGAGSRQTDQNVANLIIVTGLPNASYHIQIQALELLRTRRIFTHTAIHTAPKAFLLIFLNDVESPRLVHHLNDHIFISHYHDPEDGFSNLEEASEWVEDDRASLSSVVHRSKALQAMLAGRPATFTQEDVGMLTDLSQEATVSAEVKAYLHNIVTFLRLHRAVGGGVSPRATQNFDLLVRCLAPLHGLDFVTPSLVSLAARKVYPHRIAITNAENERSMQYGSDLVAVASLFEDVRPEDVIDDVLQQVEPPL